MFRLFEKIYSDVVFILLDKKERKLIEKVINSSPYLIHEFDDDGNNPIFPLVILEFK